MTFSVGIPRRATAAIFAETLDALDKSMRYPDRIVVVDNGERALGALDLPAWLPYDAIEIIRPRQNLGCAKSWNLLRAVTAPDDLILLNDDCAVAPDTFDRMLTSSRAIVCAYGFSCVLIRNDAWETVGDFDEGFYPAYWEDSDYRYRAKLANVEIDEWDTYPRTPVSEGRERSAQGIAHGKAEPDEYRTPEFKARVEANRQRYRDKWGCVGGDVGFETITECRR